jgi:hypothetical protein
VGKIDSKLEKYHKLYEGFRKKQKGAKIKNGMKNL